MKLGKYLNLRLKRKCYNCKYSLIQSPISDYEMPIGYIWCRAKNSFKDNNYIRPFCLIFELDHDLNE